MGNSSTNKKIYTDKVILDHSTQTDIIHKQKQGSAFKFSR